MEQEVKTLPCIICGKVPEPAIPFGVSWVQPYAATLFTTHGHYGSTVFDEMDGTFLEVSICDSHLLDAAKQGRMLMGTPERAARPDPKLEPWVPGLRWCGACNRAHLVDGDPCDE